MDNTKSTTFNCAHVVIPSTITGIESGGLGYRLDHVPVEFHKILDPPEHIISDEEILLKLIDGLK
jgi:formylmethanofuran dehydrogenase subunit B